MTVQFILGRAGSGKSSYCLESIEQALIDNPQGDPILYLVPDQMTFQAEYALVSKPSLSGMIRAQAYSFSRLALRVLQEVGGHSLPKINRLGMVMILRKIIEENKEELKVFRRSAEQNGFYDHVEQLMTEMKRYCVTVDGLRRAGTDLVHADLAADGQTLLDKLHDLQIIYAQFQSYMEGHFTTSEDMLTLLTEKIQFSAFLSKAEIYVDGFHQFSKQELLVLQELMKHSRQMKIALTLDPKWENILPDEHDLFFPTAKTYHQLRTLAHEAEVSIQPSIYPGKLREAGKDPSLSFLEAHYDQRAPIPYQGEATLSISAAVHRRAEVEGMARQIIQLVREKEYRYRDIAVLVRDLGPYHEIMETIFSDYDIPVFIDQKRSMLHHPLVECLRSSLDVIRQHWRYEAVFRCVKTDLLLDWKDGQELNEKREKADLLENYVLANGINGSTWLSVEHWKVYDRPPALDEDEPIQREEDHQAEVELHQLRMELVAPLRQLQYGLKRAKQVEEMCEQLYLFLEKLHIPAKLAYWREEAERDGQLRLAREHAQAWKAVIDLLDQLVELLGDQFISTERFIQLIETGCEQMRFSLVPPAMDQVVVGQLERSRLSQIKCIFLAGANDGILPAKLKEEGLVSEEERESLAKLGLTLAPSANEQLGMEQFMIYQALSTATEQLWISYAMADEEGRALTPSPLLQRIKPLFSSLDEQIVTNEALDVEEEWQWQFVTRPAKTLTSLTVQLSQWSKGYPLASFWWAVYNWYRRHPQWAAKSRRILSSLSYKNKAESLPLSLSQSLYGQQLLVSVSRMERFQACPFSHFLAHGLKLRERSLYRLQSPEIGQLFHAALKWMDDQLRNRELSWSRLTKRECLRLAQQAVEELAPKLLFSILHSSSRHQYVKRKLQQVLERTALVLQQQSQVSQFSPIGLEIDFGPGGQLPSISYPLEQGGEIQVVGRIDRVDLARQGNESWLRVIDYKSSQTSLQLEEVYYGLSLQILTYLDVLLTHARRWLGAEASPAGVLYFHVHNPLLQKKYRQAQELIEQELFSQYKMKGMVVADAEVVQLMDEQIQGQHSKVIPAGIKKDGSFYKNSSIANREEFSHLRSFVRQKITDIGQQIYEGVTDISPYQLKKKNPCRFCSYRAVCQFDQTLVENQFSILSPIKKEEAMQHILNQSKQQEEGREWN